MPQVIINRVGNLIDLSADGVTRLSEHDEGVVKSLLEYTQVIQVRGADAWDSYGQRRPVRTVRKAVYIEDGCGRIVCNAGHLNRIQRELESRGYAVKVFDKSPQHERPDRFTLDFDSVYKRFQLKARQDEMLLKIATKDHGIIEAPTGFGKSWSFKMVCAMYPKANILIVVSRKDVAEELHRDLTAYFPNVGLIGGGKRKQGRITVCMAHSLHNINPQEWDILLGDEAHELGAPTFVRELSRLRWTRNYGFSASPHGRQDGTSIRLEALFGDTIFKMSYQEAVEQGLIVPIKVRWLDVFMSENPCADYVDIPRLRHGLWRNDYRNKIIADAAMEYPDQQLLIMVAHFEHAVYLKKHLPDFTLCYAERKEDDKLFARAVRDGLLPQDEPRMDDKRRRMLREQFAAGTLRKVIATDVWSTGVNFHQLQVMIRADARSSSIKDTQLPGRVCRLHQETGKSFGLLIDTLDQFDPGFRNGANKRRREYKLKGWEQTMPAGNRRLVRD